MSDQPIAAQDGREHSTNQVLEEEIDVLKDEIEILCRRVHQLHGRNTAGGRNGQAPTWPAHRDRRRKPSAQRSVPSTRLERQRHSRLRERFRLPTVCTQERCRWRLAEPLRPLEAYGGRQRLARTKVESPRPDAIARAAGIATLLGALNLRLLGGVHTQLPSGSA